MRADVILVRHAQPLLPSPGGPGDYHRPLTEVGMAQAERLRHYATSWANPLNRAMPMPAIYRLYFTDYGIQAMGPGLRDSL